MRPGSEPDLLNLNTMRNQMRTRSKLALIGLGAAMLMAFAIGTASARNLSISNQNIRMTFNNLELGAEGLATTTCHVTLEGSFHERTLVKTPETLVGFLTRVTTGNCNNGVSVLRETLPWHIRYVGFSGRLPAISLILAKGVGAAFVVEPGLGFRCLFRATVSFRAILSPSTGEINGVEVPNQEVALMSGGGSGCPASSGFFRSRPNGSIMLLGAITRLTVRLI